MSKNNNAAMPDENGVYAYTGGGLKLVVDEVTKETPFECLTEMRQMTRGGGVVINTTFSNHPVCISIRMTTNANKSGWIMTDVTKADTGEYIYCEVDEVYAKFDAYGRTYKIKATTEAPVGGSHGRRKLCKTIITDVTVTEDED